MKSAAAGTFEIGTPSSKANQFLAPLLLISHFVPVSRLQVFNAYRSPFRMASDFRRTRSRLLGRRARVHWNRQI
jgi:hypothetical protein